MLYRSAALAYELYVGSLLHPRLSPSAVFSGSSRQTLENLFGLLDDVCALFQPVYGGLAFDWPGESEQVTTFNRMLRTRAVHKYGFENVAVRNYVGPDIRDRFNFELLQDPGADVAELLWNAVRFDLIHRAWDAPFEVLYSQMQRINASLAAQGLMADYSRSLLKKPGANWPAVSVTTRPG